MRLTTNDYRNLHDKARAEYKAAKTKEERKAKLAECAHLHEMIWRKMGQR